jgi:signal transduction histidine kinase
MGSRGRSIRLSIYALVAIPLITLIGLYAFVATTTIGNAVNLDRAPNLITATSEPTAFFVLNLQAERRAAVIYAFRPTQANLAQYTATAKATAKAEPTFDAAMSSPATKGAASASELTAINKMVTDLRQLPSLRQGVEARIAPVNTPLNVFGAYTKLIADEPNLFLSESASLTDATAAEQSLGLIATVEVREDLQQEDAWLSGMFAGGNFNQANRTVFSELAANRAVSYLDATSILNPASIAAFQGGISDPAKTLEPGKPLTPAQTQAEQQQQAQAVALLPRMEGAVGADVTGSRLPFTVAQWEPVATAVSAGYFAGGLRTAASQVASDNLITHAAWVRVAVVSGLGLAGLILTILVTALVGRSIIRRLGVLRRTALTLAEEQLPSVVARLRRGEDVDVAIGAPPMRAGSDEIGQVSQAFDIARQTAIRAAVDEARLRKGINDVFRSLARRSQSLLHRQLTVLDQMERRATDPDALDDLFRLDHLTTRMRRHAEGLIILSGAAPGRGWRNPVRLIDVLRGAIAEVEDYARVSVGTTSKAALSGSAVADVIHLIAELIENAATLSPPYTSVRVTGGMVASGFAIEVEDRGLGMSEQRMSEINDQLAHPPEFNLSDSEQLGLFVVGQLAKRHGIKVTLRSSPYGGVLAIVLVPAELVVIDEMDALPAGSAAAVTAGPEQAAIGDSWPAIELPLRNGSDGASGDTNGTNGDSWPATPAGTGLQLPGARISGALPRSEPRSEPGQYQPPQPGQHQPPQYQPPRPSQSYPASAEPPTYGPAVPAPDPEPTSAPVSASAQTFDVFTPVRRTQDHPAETGSGEESSYGAETSQGAATGNGGTPGYASPARPYSEPAQSPPETSRSGALPSGAAQPNGSGYEDPWAKTPSSPRHGISSPDPAPDPDPAPARDLSSPPRDVPVPAANAGDDDYKGLPRRVRQASLAPQLRRNAAASSSPLAAPFAEPVDLTANGPSPEELRSTFSAMQRGWQIGRSPEEAEPDQSSWDDTASFERSANGLTNGAEDTGGTNGT